MESIQAAFGRSVSAERTRLIKERYGRHQFRKSLFLDLLIPSVVLATGLAVAFGSADITFPRVCEVIFRKLIPALGEGSGGKNADIIIWTLRLPRILMGALAGLALGSAGSVMQVVLRNPLADPYMLGISSAAGFGASLAIAVPLVLAGELLLLFKSGDLNVMNTGDSGAKRLGVNVEGARIFAMVVCTAMVAGIVSFTGTIGFIGLVAPHIVRMIIGADNRILVPASGLVGAVLLVASDTVARTVMSPVILPVGSVTAFLGVPLFVYLIMKGRGKVL